MAYTYPPAPDPNDPYARYQVAGPNYEAGYAGSGGGFGGDTYPQPPPPWIDDSNFGQSPAGAINPMPMPGGRAWVEFEDGSSGWDSPAPDTSVPMPSPDYRQQPSFPRRNEDGSYDTEGMPEY